MMTPYISESGLTQNSPTSTGDADHRALPHRISEAVNHVPALQGTQLIVSALLMTAVATILWLSMGVLAGDRMMLVLLTASSASAMLYLAHAINAESMSQVLVDVLAFGAIISIAMTSITNLSVHLASTMMVHAVWAAFMFTQSNASARRQTLLSAMFSFSIALAMVTLLTQS